MVKEGAVCSVVQPVLSVPCSFLDSCLSFSLSPNTKVRSVNGRPFFFFSESVEGLSRRPRSRPRTRLERWMKREARRRAEAVRRLVGLDVTWRLAGGGAGGTASSPSRTVDWPRVEVDKLARREDGSRLRGHWVSGMLEWRLKVEGSCPTSANCQTK